MRRVDWSYLYIYCMLARSESSPWVFIFKRCVFRHLWYLLSLASQLCPHWTSWGSVRYFLALSPLVVYFYCSRIPFNQFHRLRCCSVSHKCSVYHSGYQFLILVCTEVPIALLWGITCLMRNCPSLTSVLLHCCSTILNCFYQGITTAFTAG